MKSQHDLIDISCDELCAVTGGFLDRAYKDIVFHFASRKGGDMLAQKMYGRHTTAADTARAEAALKKFFVDGDKLPKGAPNLFGR
jgi:hypothetical protein